MTLETAVPLAPRTTLGVGGCAEYFAAPRSAAELASCLVWAAGEGKELSILGGGSNVVVADTGVRGLTIHPRLRGHAVLVQGSEALVQIGAGESWDDFVAWSVAEGWSGLECLSGIPGSVGATPIQNVGAYGVEVSQLIEWVELLNRTTLTVERWSAEACGFAYRHSRFKAAPDDYIVTRVCFRLRREARPLPAYRELTEAWQNQEDHSPAGLRGLILELRRKKGMVYNRSVAETHGCGSFFLNPCVTTEVAQSVDMAAGRAAPRFPADEGLVKLPAGWLIEQAGFPRGFREEHAAVGLSPHHALALVAYEAATAEQIVHLARLVRSGVQERFGVGLSAEPRFLGFGAVTPGTLPGD